MSDDGDDDFDEGKRGIYDNGADECTTNDPYIIHDLALLPASERVTLYDAAGKKNPHYNVYGGYAILNECKTCPDQVHANT